MMFLALGLARGLRDAMTRANKRLGQHFLRDAAVIEATMRALELDGTETVLEVGPGKGVLTEALAAHVKRVVAVELDPGLAATLPATMPDNVDVVHGDILKQDITELGPFDKVTGNLPYQISSPLTFKILDWPFQRGVFLYQLEFAERLVADGPEDPHYGRLSVARAYRAQATLLRRVKKGAFVPPPKVMSGLVLLVPHNTPPFDVGADPAWFDLLVRDVFTQRRKGLRKALLNQAEGLGLGHLTTSDVDQVLAELRMEGLHVDAVDPAGFGRLAAALKPRREERSEGAA